MIESLILLAVVAGIHFALKTPWGGKVGKFLPTPFWIYFFPILLSTLHLIPSQSKVYSYVGLHFLPLALLLLLIGTPLKDVMRLGKPALAALLTGTAGMFMGTIISFSLLKGFLPEEGWKGAGALLGSWTGGSANLLAVKDILGLSDGGLAPLIITDTFLSYGWLAFLILGAAYQAWFDGDINKEEDAGSASFTNEKGRPEKWAGVFIGAFLLTEIILKAAGFLTQFEFLSLKGWSVVLATTCGLILAATPARKIELWGASKVGTQVLYLVLATIGAKTSLSAVSEAPVYFLFGAIVLGIHGACLLSLGRIFKIPLALLATASQANVGGPVSAPIVAGVYRPGTTHFGVLMAILAAVLGTYVGWAGGLVCRWLAG